MHHNVLVFHVQSMKYKKVQISPLTMKYFILLSVTVVQLNYVSVYSQLSHTDCIKPCLNQTSKLFLQSSDAASSTYLQCIGNCSGDLILGERDGTVCLPTSIAVQPDALSVCPPTDIIAKENWITDKESGKVVANLILFWNPCSAGIKDLKGFKIVVLPSWSSQSTCYNLTITRTLSPDDKEKLLSFVVPGILRGSTNYEFSISSLPITNANARPKRYIHSSSSCEDRNGNFSCLCGYNKKILYPAPNVTVDGYSVEVRVPLANACFSVRSYEIHLYRKNALFRYPRTIKTSSLIASEQAVENFISYKFSSIYNVPAETQLLTRVILEFDHDTAYSQFSQVNVKAWKPPEPKVETFDSDPSTIEVSFPTAGDEYGIEKYEIQILGSNFNQSIEVSKPTEGNIITKIVRNLNPGYYTVQIRELRDAEAYFTKMTQWTSKMVTLRTPDNLNLWLITVVVVLTFIIFSGIIIIITLYIIWKKGWSRKVRHHLPRLVVTWLDTQVGGPADVRSRSVLVVWQSDVRSNALSKQHAENIRNLCSYLGSVCKLDVIADFHETLKLNESISTWVQSACDRADFVLFVCPHFDVVKLREETKIYLPLLGDFFRIYNYLEKELGMKDRNKFITLLLPYAKADSFHKSKYLLNMTTSFKLMNEIEDLYFHIQGFSKVSVNEKHSAMFINEDDYLKTDQGKAMNAGFKAFKRLLLSPDTDSCAEIVDGVSLKDDDSCNSVDECEVVLKSTELPTVMVNIIKNIRPPVDIEGMDKSSYMYEDLMTLETIGESDMGSNVLNEICYSEDGSISSRHPSIQPPPPLMVDAERQLLLINAENKNEPLERVLSDPNNCINRVNLAVASPSDMVNISPLSLAESFDSVCSANNETAPKLLLSDTESSLVSLSVQSFSAIDSSSPLYLQRVRSDHQFNDSGFLSNNV